MGAMGGIFGLIGLGCGLYCLYAYFRMMKSGEINKTVLLGKDVNPNKCKDKDAYIKMIAPKLLFFGIVTCCYGLTDLYESYIGSAGYVLPIVLGLFFVTLVWFAVTTSRAARRYF